MRKKIGILGGTFDPPHYGHLFLAQEVFDRCNLDEIWFMPSNTPPHKQRSMLCTNNDRIEMVKRAIVGNDILKLSLVEFEREGRSYTIDTIKYLKEMYEDVDFYFIIGGDMIQYLPEWKEIDELLTLVTFIGIDRPGYQLDPTDKYVKQVIKIAAPQLEISSSEIRERLLSQQSVRYLLPDLVLDYIKERGIYGHTTSAKHSETTAY